MDKNKEKKFLEEKIEQESRRIKKYDDIQQELETFTRSLNRCIELAGLSVIDPLVTAKLSEYQMENAKLYYKAKMDIKDDIRNAKKDIKDWTSQISELSKEEEKKKKKYDDEYEDEDKDEYEAEEKKDLVEKES